MPAFFYVAGDYELHEAHHVWQAVFVADRKLLQRLRLLRSYPVPHTDARLRVREEGGAKSHTGVELLGNKRHAKTLPSPCEEVHA
jgi:hypothetical protein